MRRWMGLIAREPLFHFLGLGLLIWCGIEYRNAHHDHYTISIGPAQRKHMADTYQRQFGQSPTPAQLRELMDRYVREEILLREGLALHLDLDDEIVRRRIIQKYEFLQMDLAVPDGPGPGSLERWFERNTRRYLIPERVAFTQVYFSADEKAEAAARARALRVLEQLRLSKIARAPDLGDPFPGPSDPGALGQTDAVRLFGESQLSEQLFQAPAGHWEGPFRSGYGWHLIHVTQHLPPLQPPLRDIRKRVLADYEAEQRDALNALAFEKLRAKYNIIDDAQDR